MICITNHTSINSICQEINCKHIILYVIYIITLRHKQDLFQKLRQSFPPADFGLCVNNFSVNDFSRLACISFIHSSNPQHRGFCFELFSHPFLISHFFDQSEHHFRSLFVNISKITVQFSACEKRSVNYPFMFL